MIYPSDRHGFNNPDREWDSSQVDLALTGDSFSHGFSVPPGEDIAGQIRLITGKNVLNLGMAGNGPLAELAALKEYAESKKPKTVLWLFHESSDMADLAREASIPLLRSYLQPNFSQNLIHRQQEIDNRLLEFIGRQTFLSTTRILRLTSLRQKLSKLSSRGGAYARQLRR